MFKAPETPLNGMIVLSAAVANGSPPILDAKTFLGPGLLQLCDSVAYEAEGAGAVTGVVEDVAIILCKHVAPYLSLSVSPSKLHA